jgi:hypothetical protein
MHSYGVHIMTTSLCKDFFKDIKLLSLNYGNTTFIQNMLLIYFLKSPNQKIKKKNYNYETMWEVPITRICINSLDTFSKKQTQLVIKILSNSFSCHFLKNCQAPWTICLILFVNESIKIIWFFPKINQIKPSNFKS